MHAVELRPRAKYVLVERVKKDVTESGLVLVQEKLDTLFEGIVTAVGEGCWSGLNVGNKVLFLPYGSNEVNLREIMDPRWVFAVPEADIFAVEEA